MTQSPLTSTAVDALDTILQDWLDDAMSTSSMSVGINGYKGITDEEAIYQQRALDYNSFLNEAKAKIAALIRNAKLETINKIYELSPTNQFKDWKPQDALAFYERLKAYEKQLTEEVTDHDDSK